MKSPPIVHRETAHRILLYLDVPDELLCWCFDGNFAVYRSLYGIRPPHGFIQHFGVKTVRVFTTMDNYIPITWVSMEKNNYNNDKEETNISLEDIQTT